MEADPMVSLLGKSLVVPAAPTKIRHLFLSCLDIMWQDIHYNRRIIFYKHSGPDLSSAIGTLKRSLSLVLVHFYPWAGRLTLGEDRRLMIDCNDLGVEFVEASIDLPISALEKNDFQMKGFFEKLCQHVEHKNGSLYASPLLSVQATRFSDGGLAVAVAHSHLVADGHSLWHFMVSWGECARGEKLSLEPLHDRTKLAVEDPSPEKAVLRLKVAEDEDEDERAKEKTRETKTENLKANITENGATKEKLTENGGKTTNMENGKITATEHDAGATNNTTQAPEVLVQHTFQLSEAAIKKLKREAGAATTGGRPYSTYEVLCAHFWQRVTIARRRPASEPVHMVTLVNSRSRLIPALPPAYYGNAIGIVAAISDAGTIGGEGIGETAARIRATSAACSEERLRGVMHWVELHDNRLFPHIKFEGRCMSVASSPKFPVYQVDFGWGNPAAVRAVKVPGDGEMVLFGGRPGSRAGDVEICMPLPSQTMQNLVHDPHFLASTQFFDNLEK